MLRRQLVIEWAVIALFTCCACAALSLTRATARIDNAIYDLLIGFYAPSPSDRIIIVAIDDTSIAKLGAWPWPRAVHAQAIDVIGNSRPSAIVYDVLFTEPSERAQDLALAKAVRNTPTILPILVETPGTNGNAYEVRPPIAPVAAAARGLGHVVMPHEQDGSGRAALMAFSQADRQWPHAMELAYRLAYRTPSAAFLRGQDIVLVPYQTYSGGFRSVPFAAVLRGEVPPAFFADKIVLVGSTAGGLGDRHSVPMREGGTLAGVEVQANLLTALIDDRLVRAAGPIVSLIFALAPSLILLASFWLLRPARALTASLAMILAVAALPVITLIGGGYWLAPTPALAGVLLAYPLWGWRRLQALDTSIRRELKRFASEALVTAEPAPGRWFADPIGWQTEQLSESIARLRDLRRMVSDALEGIANPLIVTTLDDRVILANSAATALLGEDLVGAPAPTIIQPELEELMIEKRIFLRRRTALADRAGMQRGWIILLAEITAIRDAERAQEEAIEFLSHDMRSPQVSILALLESQPRELVAEPVRERISALARHTLELAENFVQLARLGCRPFAPEVVDLGDSLADAIDTVWPQATRRGVRIIGQGFDESACLLGERDTLTRLFINLLDNAVKFGPDAGEIRCRIEQDREVGTLVAAIEDQGAGIEPDRVPSLFGRFGATALKGGGAGLGLAYAKAAAERHGGSIVYESNQPHGARLVVTLPVDSGALENETG